MAISTSKHCPSCGSDHKGKPFAVYEDGYHCFSCGKSKRSIRNFTTKALKCSEGVELPELTRNPSLFSLNTLKWLRSYHMTDDLIYKYCIAEAVDNSLIMPVIKDRSVVMYQRRWFGEVRRIMTYGNKQPFIASSVDGSKTIAIVEDFISAIRVGETVDCYCMFGTAVPYDRLVEIIKTYDTIIIWADGDLPGQLAAHGLVKTIEKLIKVENRRRAFACNFNKIVINVLTDLDPKCYTNTEIKTILQTSGALNDQKNTFVHIG